MEGPQEACDKAGVQLPSELGADHLDGDAGVCVRGGGGEEEEEERAWGVCTELNGADIEVPCGHFFCRDCWQQYLHTKIQSGEIHTIVCPAYGCYKLVPMVS